VIADLKPYPAYKDSGLPWLGEVPAHWSTAAVKRHYEIQLGKMLQNTPNNSEDIRIPYLKAQHVQWFAVRTTSLPSMWASPAEVVKYGVQAGDLLVCEGGEGGRSGILDGIEGPVIIQNALHRVRPAADCRNDFLQYVMSVVSAIGWFDAINNKATIAHFTRDKFGTLGIPLPPLSEQAAIVRYLDHVDHRIRRYIRAKQKLIALLTEQKQAIIHQAVTRGLDPDVRLKPSGVEWLGDVPEHWEVVRSKRVFSPRTELAQSGDIQLSATQAYGVISQEEYERRVGRKIVKIFRHLEKRRHVEVDDFVISMRSFQGGLERDWERGCIRSSYVVLKPSQRLCVSYFAQLFKSYGYIGALQATANFIRDGQDLNYDNFCAVDLPWPPPNEQEQIAAALDSALAGLVKTAIRAEREISLRRGGRVAGGGRRAGGLGGGARRS
jgi:type I restriction enzyme S subunit